MSFITPPQLQSIIEKVKDAIQAGATDLSPYSAILRDPITLAELNAGDHLKTLNTVGLRVVRSNTMINGISIQFFNALYFTEIYIGPTDSIGDVDALASATYNGYAKQPGLSIAIRYKVNMNYMFDKTVVTANGLTQWHVMPLANFSGFLTGQGGSGESCSCKTWKGTQAEYDAIASKDPDTIYYITEA